MKHEIHETESTVVYCAVLEDADLEAMTDIELGEELDVWQRTAACSDDDDYDVIDNVRLIETHIARRAAAAELAI